MFKWATNMSFEMRAIIATSFEFDTTEQIYGLQLVSVLMLQIPCKA